MYPNLSPWSVIPNESSFGKIGHDEQGRLLETIITCKTCHIKCNVFITFYKFYATARLTMICKKLYAQDMTRESFIDVDMRKKHYPEEDYHTLYIAEIEKILLKEL